jgi:cupin 2 domain-containing protein
MTMAGLTNLLENVPADLAEEVFQTLPETPGVRVKRSVSRGHASPEGFRYDQETHDWVLLLSVAARLRLEGDEPLDIRPSSFVHLPAHRRHRVE